MLIQCSRCNQPNEATALYCKTCRVWFNELPVSDLSQSISNLPQPIKEASKQIDLLQSPINKSPIQLISEKPIEKLVRYIPRQLTSEKSKKNVKPYLLLTSLLVLGGVFLIILISQSYLQQSSQGETTFVADTALAPSSEYAPISKLAGNTIEGKVIDVTSGDTLTVLDKNNREYKIKLAGIDAPGTKLDFGQAAKENLSALALDKNVLVVLSKTVTDGSAVGKILQDGKDINIEQVKVGMARHNEDAVLEQSEETRQLYKDAEIAAKTIKIGIWSTPDLLPEAKTEIPGAKVETKSERTKTNPAPSPANSASAPLIAQPPTPNVETPAAPKSKGESTAARSATAKARCVDGTLSYSQTRSETCSRHGGVKEWLGVSSPSTKIYIRGLEGGCYYVTSSGSRNYVDRDKCN